MSIQRYDILHPKMRDKGRFVLYADHIADKDAELHNILSPLADIRAALGVGEKPMLSELAGIVQTRMGVIKILERDAKENAAEVERLTADRDAAIKRCDALSQELKLTEEELDDVQGKLDEAEEFSSASLTLILRHVGEPEIEEDDFVSITDLEQSIMRHNAVSDAAVRERDAACEALRIVVDSDDRAAKRHAASVLEKIERGRNGQDV